MLSHLKCRLRNSAHSIQFKLVNQYAKSTLAAAAATGNINEIKSMNSKDSTEQVIVKNTTEIINVEEFRKTHQINLTGASNNDFEPFLTFDSTPFSSQIKQKLLQEGYTTPTPIQAQSWAIALQRKDLISVARTGSGKTCGYLLPALHFMTMNKSTEANNNQTKYSKFTSARPRVLVLAPTRELGVQIRNEAEKFARVTGLKTTCLYGGSDRLPQIADLKRGVDIVVATPGRANDLIEAGYLDLRSISYLVFDEADRM
jgi:ATP-dependent RNA helicase DDX5/DBP2